ncbi:hypothetical protein [Alkalihalobacillus deserti]|uniref:hypothetical protein n=1 Tax=Alkalihalobacillus deserti TaxID=2879466 RepID=UPI001D1432C1|nr:hypothetical protein [Alkalihalobacillus deserti]
MKKYTHLEEEWIQLYNIKHLNFTEIAKKYNVQVETVSRYIKDRVRKRTKSPFKSEVEKWVSFYQKGKSFAEIARECNVSETAVKTNIYKEMNPIIEDLKWTWIALYRKGVSLKSIGDTYHFHQKIIHNTIKDEINIPNANNRNVYQHLIDEWAKLYTDGLSFEVIAKKYHVSADTVYRNTRDKVDIRCKKTKSKAIKELIPVWRNLYYQKGYTLQEIGEKYNISTSTVYRHVRNHK